MAILLHQYEMAEPVLAPNTELSYSELLWEGDERFADESRILGRGSHGNRIGHSFRERFIEVAGRLWDVSRGRRT
jgi:hypothetical protein